MVEHASLPIQSTAMPVNAHFLITDTTAQVKECIFCIPRIEVNVNENGVDFHICNERWEAY